MSRTAGAAHGEGIAYGPLADIVREIMRAAGADPGRQSVAAIAEILAVTMPTHRSERVGACLSGSERKNQAPAEETFWAIRRFFEVLARERPLVIVVDDLHGPSRHSWT